MVDVRRKTVEEERQSPEWMKLPSWWEARLVGRCSEDEGEEASKKRRRLAEVMYVTAP